MFYNIRELHHDLNRETNKIFRVGEKTIVGVKEVFSKMVDPCSHPYCEFIEI